ncbi:hypothetical protein WICPIJ_003443 [Wickerhamomyces pijperi]|uniref:TAFII28-like protein domain-containing protein n=1 Tax=Wickerhamomyces pijperi TaxID=599730 RepID=A0A9P8TP80_WICPI|nr:hypothetical protein WICPIJ_003443 [Wickerhamomyces pijperi]
MSQSSSHSGNILQQGSSQPFSSQQQLLQKQQNITTAPTGAEEEENDSDLDLSDVPMDELEFEDEEDDDDEEYDDLYEKYQRIIDNEEDFIRKKLLQDINPSKVNINDDSNHYGEQPMEEFDKDDKLRLLIENLDEDQMARYSTYRRATISRNTMKKIVNATVNQSVSLNVAIAISGISKIFVGEIIEKAIDIKKRYDKAKYLIKLNEKKELNELLKVRLEDLELCKDPSESMKIQEKINEINKELKKMNLLNVNENGPLLPDHIREAWRLYRLENNPPSHQWALQGERDGLMFR